MGYANLENILFFFNNTIFYFYINNRLFGKYLISNRF